MIQSFFVSSSVVINRIPTADASKALDNNLVSNGCQCVSCRQCDNHCNKQPVAKSLLGKEL